MKGSISARQRNSIFADLRKANLAFKKQYPGDNANRQAIHTVYGGAHIFKANTAESLGKIALGTLQTYAPNFVAFAKAMGLEGHENLPTKKKKIKQLATVFSNTKAAKRRKTSEGIAWEVYQKTCSKLKSEAVEDFRIDFEDGYGNRPDDEEDAAAVKAAKQVAIGMKKKSLPPFIGIRIKPFTEELKMRSVRTLDLFLTTLLTSTKGKLPANFIVMLPKVTIPEQIRALVRFFEIVERKHKLPNGSLLLEIMVETTQSIMASDGKNPLKQFMRAAKGRCRATHFGTYDYTASCDVTANYQEMDHPVCDFAHHMTKVALAHTGVHLSDGATNTMPVGPHRGEKLSKKQRKENKQVVHRSWKKGYQHIRHSLWNGYYQGWDLHPSQLPMRYAAVYAFFLEGLAEATERLKIFVDQAARATLIGDVFDDAATGQGLLNYFIRAYNSGAINEKDIKATGLTLDEIRSKSFKLILANRKKSS